jgi:hypothetical protein
LGDSLAVGEVPDSLFKESSQFALSLCHGRSTSSFFVCSGGCLTPDWEPFDGLLGALLILAKGREKSNCVVGC